jgi:hypothetical protein
MKARQPGSGDLDHSRSGPLPEFEQNHRKILAEDIFTMFVQHFDTILPSGAAVGVPVANLHTGATPRRLRHLTCLTRPTLSTGTMRFQCYSILASALSGEPRRRCTRMATQPSQASHPDPPDPIAPPPLRTPHTAATIINATPALRGTQAVEPLLASPGSGSVISWDAKAGVYVCVCLCVCVCVCMFVFVFSV